MIRRVHILVNQKIPGIENQKRRVERIIRETGAMLEPAPGPETDLIVTLGGDGILLKGVHLAQRDDALIMGVNFGRVGFLTGPADDLEDRMACVLQGTAPLSKRMGLDVAFPGEHHEFCLNEVFLFRKGIRIVTLTITRNGEPCMRLRCDGAIIATPTGSSAHALAAGGPLLHPQAHAILIVPVNPFTLAWRPTVLPPDDRLTVTADGECCAICDGQREESLAPDTALEITRARRTVTLVLDERSLFRTIRNTFGWSL